MKTYNFKNARKACKLKLYQAAEMLNITNMTLLHYEKGQTDPNVTTLLKMAEIYGTTVDELLIINETEK